jgi:hypothetical protein
MRRPPIAEPGAPSRSRWLAVLPCLLLGPLLASADAQGDEPKPEPKPPVVSTETPEPEPEADGTPERPRRVGPTVRSIHEVEVDRRFRRPGSDDPYGESIDWRTVPLWQQATFYGIRAKGSFFVFVVDCSGSMEVDSRLVRAKQELRRSINAMRFPQRFLIIFFNHRSIPMAGGIPKSADAKGKQTAMAWLGTVDAGGGTDPRAAMKLALALRPDAVFLLSDGEFPSGSEDEILDGNRHRVPIHCINLGSAEGAPQLQAISEGSGGQYTFKR